MQVTIYSNIDAQCGNSTYGVRLYCELQKYFPETLLYDCVQSNPRNVPGDVIIVNWHPAKVSVDADLVKWWRNAHKKVILVLQNSFDWCFQVDRDDILAVCNAVVAHEEMQGNYPIRYIPHGIIEPPNVEYHICRPYIVGTAGFPFKWKRPEIIAKLVAQTDCHGIIYCPPYNRHYNQDLLEEEWRRFVPVDKQNRLRVYKIWTSELAVIDTLKTCACNVFWFQSEDVHDQLGQTGSARLGLASGRPIIISTHRKFRDLAKFEDEIYIAETEEDVYTHVNEIFGRLDKGAEVKTPKRILKEMGWTRIGQMYANLIQSL